MPTPARSAPASGPVWVVVVAGGGGNRFSDDGRRVKQYVEIAGRRVLDWSVATAGAVADGVVVVVPASRSDIPVADADRVVAGGATRSESVRCGLAAVPPGAGVIVVHDAARPAASASLFRRVIEAVAGGADGVVPGVDVVDSLRARDGGPVDRSRLVAVQTPQAFRADLLLAAHRGGDEATDDATLVEQAGGTIEIVQGETTNRKLTHPGDELVLEQVLRAAQEIRS